MSLFPSCGSGVSARISPSPRVYARCEQGGLDTIAALSGPVRAVVTCSPVPARLTVSGDFVLLPLVGGGTARVPYDPVA